MKREAYLQRIIDAYAVHSVVAILGPRQCGKTTLAKMFVATMKDQSQVHYFDLEDPTDLEKFRQPKLILSELSGLIVIDEIQKLPDLFPLLRVLVDQYPKQRYLILGSASRDLVKQSSESLAGRIFYLELSPFAFFETHDLKPLWLRGGFPRAYLAESLTASNDWRKAYIKTFLDQDIPNLGIHIPALTLRRFWMMLTHYHGNIFNASELGQSFGIADTTVRRYLDILAGTFMVRQLPPWIAKINKRQVKSPKIYFRDSGILHSLLDINDDQALLHHPKLGASWEGMALEEVIRNLQVDAENCFFWNVHGQAELDLLVFHGGKKLGFEFKFAAAPKLTNSMQTAIEILELDSLKVICPGKEDYPLAENIRVVGIENLLQVQAKSII